MLKNIKNIPKNIKNSFLNKIKKISLIFIFFLFYLNFYLSSLSFANSVISYDEKYLSYLSGYSRYFLWDLENNKLILTKNVSNSINRIFYVDNENLALFSNSSLSISNNKVVKILNEYNLNSTPLFLYSLISLENYYRFLLLTDKTMNLCEIRDEKFRILSKQIILKPSNILSIGDNSFIVSANRFVYLYKIWSFLGFNFISKKKTLIFDRLVTFVDVDNKKNKLLVLTSDGKLNLYTINFQNLKTIDLNPSDQICLYALNNSDIIVSDKTEVVRIYSFSGSLKNTLNLPDKVMDILKTTDKIIIIYGNPDFPKLRIIDKEYNTIADI